MFAAEIANILRARAVRAFLIALVAILAALVQTQWAAAAAPREYAGIVVDAKTGKTLYARAADAARYPASVTKVMTLYILFQELEAGRVTLKSKFKISEHAAAAVPTKLGLRPGSTITVDDAIKAIVTLSANDIARAIAENIAGSESAFAKRMTKTAHELGMSRTVYYNASGLPDSRQTTTVRDQARLGVAIYEHFPKYYHYFQTRSFKYGRRVYGNHNQLLGRVAGVDGIKTGYTHAAGYNLLTAARRSDRHIVVAGFGFSTGSSRNAKVASLIKKYLPKARRGSYLASAEIARPGRGRTGVASGPAIPAPLPGFRLAALNRTLPASAVPTPVDAISVASIGDTPVPEPRPVDLAAQRPVDAVAALVAQAEEPPPQPHEFDVIGAWISQTLKLDEQTGQLTPPMPVGSLRPAGVDYGTDAGEIGWVVQIGATPSEQGAHTLLAAATDNIQSLTGYHRYVERFEKNGQVFFRARFAGFAGREQAASVCDQLKREKMSCLALQG